MAMLLCLQYLELQNLLLRHHLELYPLKYIYSFILFYATPVSSSSRNVVDLYNGVDLILGTS